LLVPVYLTLTRTAWITLGLGVLAWVAITGLRTLGLLLLACASSLVLVFPSVVDRFASSGLRLTGRDTLWAAFADLYRDLTQARQWSGVGWGDVAISVAPYLP